MTYSRAVQIVTASNPPPALVWKACETVLKTLRPTEAETKVAERIIKEATA